MIVTKNGLPDDVKLLDSKIGESVIEPFASLRILGKQMGQAHEYVDSCCQYF